MKLLFVSEYYPASENVDLHGGVEARVYEIASRLSRRHKVVVITSAESGKPREQVLAGVKIKRVGLDRNYTRTGQHFTRLIFILSVIWSGLFLDFDLIEGSGFMGWFPALVLSRLKKKRRVALVADTMDVYASDAGRFSYKLLQFLQKYLLKKNWDSLICISWTIRNKLRIFDIKSPIHVVYCGVNLQQIKNINVVKARRPTICCVSRLVPYKRIKDLIFATAILRQYLQQLQVDIVGSGEELEKLKKLCQEKQLEKIIKFSGFLPNHHMVIKHIKRAWIFCLPSQVEGFGIVTIEAMAAGVPVVVSDIPTNREVTQGKGAVFFEPANYQDLAQKLTYLLSHKQNYQKLTMQTKKVASRYDWEIIYKQTEKLYENLCAD